MFNLPTDSIYKFAVFAGIALAIYVQNEINSELAPIQQSKRELSIKIAEVEASGSALRFSLDRLNSILEREEIAANELSCSHEKEAYRRRNKEQIEAAVNRMHSLREAIFEKSEKQTYNTTYAKILSETIIEDAAAARTQILLNMPLMILAAIMVYFGFVNWHREYKESASRRDTP